MSLKASMAWRSEWLPRIKRLNAYRGGDRFHPACRSFEAWYRRRLFDSILARCRAVPEGDDFWRYFKQLEDRYLVRHLQCCRRAGLRIEAAELLVRTSVQPAFDDFTEGVSAATKGVAAWQTRDEILARVGGLAAEVN